MDSCSNKEASRMLTLAAGADETSPEEVVQGGNPLQRAGHTVEQQEMPAAETVQQELTIPASTVILAARSPVFKKMFSSRFREGKQEIRHAEIRLSSGGKWLNDDPVSLEPTGMAVENACALPWSMYSGPWTLHAQRRF